MGNDQKGAELMDGHGYLYFGHEAVRSLETTISDVNIVPFKTPLCYSVKNQIYYYTRVGQRATERYGGKLQESCLLQF